MNRRQERAMFAKHKTGISKEWFDSEDRKIPDSPYFVTLNDKFLSGWGRAEGKKNKLVIPVKNLREAELVKQEAESRDDFTDVKIHDVEHGNAKLPLFDKNKNYVQLKTRDDMPKLFKKVHFEETGQHWRP